MDKSSKLESLYDIIQIFLFHLTFFELKLAQYMIPYQDYIGARLFTPTYKPQIVNHLSSSLRINNEILRLATKKALDNPTSNLDKFIADLKRDADRIVRNMIADISSTGSTRFFGWTVKTIISRMYHHGVHIRESEIEIMRDAARVAEKKGISLVFLPSHKSHSI